MLLIVVQALYHDRECRSLFGYATHCLFCRGFTVDASLRFEGGLRGVRKPRRKTYKTAIPHRNLPNTATVVTSVLDDVINSIRIGYHSIRITALFIWSMFSAIFLVRFVKMLVFKLKYPEHELGKPIFFGRK